jgi:Bacterial PH domain
MSNKTSSSQHLIRQRSPLGLAAACGVTGLVLLVSMVWHWADDPQPLFVAFVIFVLALVWALFVRPAVIIDEDGVTIRNVFRDVHIPWAGVTDVEFRWNLKVFVGERAYTAWAISSQVERPKGVSGGLFSMMPGRLEKYAAADARASTPAPKVTAAMVAQTIEQAKAEYDEAVANGTIPAAPDARVRITWVPMVFAIVVLPALAVVALSLS